MAGHGPAPRLNRSRRGAPARGDWTKLRPLRERVLPDLDEFDVPDDREAWPRRTRLLWEAWAEALVTAVWTPDDIALAVDSVYLHATAPTSKAAELRLRMESLGLTPKGRRDGRLLLPDEEPPLEAVRDERSKARQLPEAL